MSFKYFDRDDFKCKGTSCCNGSNKTEDAFIGSLDELRERVGFPLIVSSGYRCPEHNQKVSSTGPNGPHTTGRAVDLAVSHDKAWFVLNEAFRMGFTGVGVNGKGAGRFIHLDAISDPDKRPRVWSY